MPAKTPRLMTCEMLAAEMHHVLGDAAPVPQHVHADAVNLKLNALCLSGGGIRSAAFCLGVLQALAERRLLRGFHYLSTVSGGGFIGGWMQQLLRDEGQREAQDAEQRVARVEALLSEHEPGPINRLRDKTNYLTPKPGPASADTWAGVALYVRNMVLNWIIFLPVFLLIALLPIFHRTLIWWAGNAMTASHAWSIGPLIVLMLLLGYGVFQTCRWLPSHREASQRIGPENQRTYFRMINTITVVALGWALLLPIWLQTLLSELKLGPWFHPSLVIPGFYFVVVACAYALAARRRSDDPAPDLFTANAAHWLCATLGAALFMGVVLHVLLVYGPCLVANDLVADVLTLAGPIVLLGIFLAQTTFYLGLRREALYGALDREWLARLNGRVLAIGVGWTVFAICCLVPSRLLTLTGGVSQVGGITFTAISALASGFASSWLGKQVVSRVQALADDPTKTEQLVKLAQLVLPLVFVVALFAFLAALLQIVLGHARLEFGTPMPNVPDVVPVLLQIAVGAILFGLTWWLRGIVNVNRFSMHAVYRNRLVRGFLGTPRDPRVRKPDPFTDFDDEDDPRLKAFRTSAGKGQRLFPVINMTLNITSGERDAWAERKGASFTATPLHCGSADLRHAKQNSAEDAAGVYVPTEDFAGKETDQDKRGTEEGTHLGTMMTVSGAAASPNWGYHSSPQIAFLMTLFNFRLGAWYPNPARATDDELRVAKPRDSLVALLNELLGRTTDNEQAVYLSDGGHFENLGVYEMLRRRCKRILVIDAGQDGECAYFDLGMMIRKAEIDFPVKIELATTQIASRSAIEKGFSGRLCGFAHGTITYLGKDGEEAGCGELIYIKPCLLLDSPAAVLSFAAGRKTFPHESTSDQWFTESQFESYRALGEFQGGKLTALLPLAEDDRPSAEHLEKLFDAARGYFAGTTAAVVAPACCV